MRNKYVSLGLNYDLIKAEYPDLSEYELILMTYLKDEFFQDLKKYLKDEDQAMAMDALKGLYIMASELKIFDLYMALLDVYELVDEEEYTKAKKAYKVVSDLRDKLLRGFLC